MEEDWGGWTGTGELGGGIYRPLGENDQLGTLCCGLNLQSRMHSSYRLDCSMSSAIFCHPRERAVCVCVCVCGDSERECTCSANLM